MKTAIVALEAELRQLRRWLAVIAGVGFVLLAAAIGFLAASDQGQSDGWRPAQSLSLAFLLLTVAVSLSVGVNIIRGSSGRIGAIAIAALAMGAGMLAVFWFVLKPDIENTIEATIKTTIETTIETGCPVCRDPDAALPRNFHFECGGPEPVQGETEGRHSARVVSTFWTLEPPDPHPRRSRDPAGSSPFTPGPIEPGGPARQIDDVAEDLRLVEVSGAGRSLAALILIGSTDPRQIVPGEVDRPHRDNSQLALARARWVRARLREVDGLGSVPIFIVNSHTLPIARLVLQSDDGGPSIPERGREVFVCALWNQPEPAPDQ